MNAYLPTDAGFRTNPNRAVRKVASWVGGAAFVVAAGSLCFMLVYAIVNGASLAELAERHKAAEIDQENRWFCQKFGVGPETSAFATCASDLMQIRRRHEERISDPGLI
jgi:hypothetical protein